MIETCAMIWLADSMRVSFWRRWCLPFSALRLRSGRQMKKSSIHDRVSFRITDEKIFNS